MSTISAVGNGRWLLWNENTPLLMTFARGPLKLWTRCEIDACVSTTYAGDLTRETMMSTEEARFMMANYFLYNTHRCCVVQSLSGIRARGSEPPKRCDTNRKCILGLESPMRITKSKFEVERTRTCIPRNSIVVEIGLGLKLVDALSSPRDDQRCMGTNCVDLQFKTTIEYLNWSPEEARPVTKATTLKAHPRDPLTETPILCPKGPPTSFGIMALDTWAME